eukprot:TRINITY_DN327_c0_g1_i1.p1 TRINITY_DN327_c0_g1~~TRINITY_DN327_c0_g1_i1.p1  ORF type:complete len:160 (-),score=18.91 TRINITY_DN327_c0_g1_i1:68-547(-)
MPRHLISDAHEWINEIPTVPTYYSAKPLRRGSSEVERVREREEWELERERLNPRYVPAPAEVSSFTNYYIPLVWGAIIGGSWTAMTNRALRLPALRNPHHFLVTVPVSAWFITSYPRWNEKISASYDKLIESYYTSMWRTGKALGRYKYDVDPFRPDAV